MNNKTKRVINGYTHKQYNEVTELSKFYTQIVTGKGYGELIVNYKPRETDKQKAQRVRITQNRTKSIAGKVEGFFKRVFRADKLKFDVCHENEQRSAQIGQYLNNYGNDGQNLITWSEETALFYNNVDPNAFYWVRHTITDGLDNFDPFIFTSEEVKDYQIIKGAVNYCVCQLSETVRYMSDNTQREKLINVFYTFTVVGLQLSIELENVETVNDKAYIIIFEPSDVGAVPVTRVGYRHDKNTGGKTYVSFWDSATEEYKQLVNRGSEYDLSLTLHCSGTGKQVHTSSQDVIEVQLPNADGEPVAVAPKDLVFYVNVPFDIVKQQKADVSEYTPKIMSLYLGSILATNKAQTQRRHK